MFFLSLKLFFFDAYAWVPLGTPGYPWVPLNPPLNHFQNCDFGVHRASFSDTTKSTQIQAALKKTSLLEI